MKFLILAFLFPVVLAGIGITYSLQGSGFVHDGTSICYEFDLLARADAEGSNIGAGIVYLGYNPAAFGSGVAGAGNVSLSGPLAEHPLYVNILADTEANILGITFEYFSFPGYGIPLTTTAQTLLTVRLRVQDPVPGANICFWPQMDDQLWDVYMVGQQYTDDSETLYSPVGVGDCLTQPYAPQSFTIHLEEGWNLVSSPVAPADSGLEAVFAELRTAGQLVKVQNSTGQTYEQNLGGAWINSIGAYAADEGYYARVNAACDLRILGFRISLPLTLSLAAGWNIIAYPCASPLSAQAVLQPLIDGGLLVKAQNGGGQALYQSASGAWINSIGDCLPGQGYYVQVSAPCQLTITPPPANPAPAKGARR